MNDRVKNLWVSALRSGKYKKASGSLCRDDEVTGGLCYCALGVLCAVYQEEKGFDNLEDNEVWQHSKSYNLYTMDNCTGCLPYCVTEWAGLRSVDPHVNLDGELRCSISELNDAHSMSFNAIADVIEKSL